MDFQYKNWIIWLKSIDQLVDVLFFRFFVAISYRRKRHALIGVWWGGLKKALFLRIIAYLLELVLSLCAKFNQIRFSAQVIELKALSMSPLFQCLEENKNANIGVLSDSMCLKKDCLLFEMHWFYESCFASRLLQILADYSFNRREPKLPD